MDKEKEKNKMPQYLFDSGKYNDLEERESPSHQSSALERLLPDTSLAQTCAAKGSLRPRPSLLDSQFNITVVIQDLFPFSNSLSCLAILQHLLPLPHGSLGSRPSNKHDLPTPLPPHVRITRVVGQTPQRMHRADFRPAVPCGQATRGGAPELCIERVQHPGIVSWEAGEGVNTHLF